MANLEELLAGSYDAKASGRTCWAQTLPPEPKEYIERLEAAMLLGSKPVVARVSRILRDHFGLSVAVSAVGHHLTRKECACPR